MKIALVTYGNGDTHEKILIENHDDLIAYGIHMGIIEKEVLNDVITSDMPIDKFDHMIPVTGEAKSLMGHALLISKLSTTENANPLYSIGIAKDIKLKNFERYINQGRTILVNEVGGYHFLDNDATFVILEKDTLEDDKESVVIKNNTRIINLENDKKLEVDAVKWMEANDANYSYVRKLRRNMNKLIKIFTEFKSKGGTIIYVYTTGLDNQQMYDYFHAGLQAGITEYNFTFVAGMTDKINDFIEYAKGKATVKLV